MRSNHVTTPALMSKPLWPPFSWHRNSYEGDSDMYSHSFPRENPKSHYLPAPFPGYVPTATGNAILYRRQNSKELKRERTLKGRIYRKPSSCLDISP